MAKYKVVVKEIWCDNKKYLIPCQEKITIWERIKEWFKHDNKM